MRWRICVVIILPLAICALIALLLPSPRTGNFRLWRMRVNVRKGDSTRPMPRLERMLDGYLSRALGESTNTMQNIMDYEKQLLATGRLCQRDFPLLASSDPKAYKKLWDGVCGATALDAHLLPQGKQGLTGIIWTNLQLIAVAEDMPKVEKLVAQFNSKAREQGGVPFEAPGWQVQLPAPRHGAK
jgi:hypothetical protein